MSHVWVVQEHYDYEGACLLGVYATESDAIVCAVKQMAKDGWENPSESSREVKKADRYDPDDHWWERRHQRMSAEKWEVE